MQTTRVLMTADTVGGVWTYALDLARMLAARDCEVTLAAMGGSLPPAQARAVSRMPGIHLYESSFKLEWMDDSWADVEQAGDWLLHLAARTQPDIVHLNSYAHGALPWRAPVLMVAHSCVLSWWQAVKGEPAPPSWQRYANAVRRGLQAADMLVAPTHAMLESLRTHYGPLPPAQVIANGRDPQSFTLPRTGPAVKEPVVLAVGRLWDEAKNVQVLDQAAPAMDWPVHVAGDDWHPSGRRVLFAHVHTLGQLAPHDLAAWYARAAIYALPARYEPFGLSVLEAALAGCALVLGDIASLREVWGSAATYVPPGDPRALAHAVNRLSRDGRLRTRLGQAARARAQQYTQTAMGAGYWHAYQSLLLGAALPLHEHAQARARQAIWQQAAVLQTSTHLGR